MFSKTALFCAFIASAQITFAQQPYCVLTAVNKFARPADQQTLCCKDASQVQNYIDDLCPSQMKSDALSAFKTACEQAGYGSCSSSSSSSLASATSSASSSGSVSGFATESASVSSAPYPIVFTSTYFDTVCSCTKTTSISSIAVAGSTGFATGTAPLATGTAAASGSGAAAGGAGSDSGPAATGSPIVPVAPSKTGAGAAGSTFTGAATKNIGSVAAGLLAVAGIAVAL